MCRNSTIRTVSWPPTRRGINNVSSTVESKVRTHHDRSKLTNAGPQEKFQSRQGGGCGRWTTSVPGSNNLSGAKLRDRLVVVTVFPEDFIGVFALFRRRMHHVARCSAELDRLI